MKTKVYNNFSQNIFEMLDNEEMSCLRGGKSWKKFYKTNVVPKGKDVFDPDEH